MKLLNGRNLLSLSLLAAASGFGGTIGSFAEATVDTSMLIVTQWGIPQGSYVLTLDRFAIAASSPVGVVSPTVAVSSNTPAAPAETTTNRTPSAPVIIMQPNLGFQVVLTADYLYQAPESYSSPASLMATATNTNSGSGTQPYTISTSDASSIGVSNAFTDAPVLGNQLSQASALYMGDSAVPPTVLAAPTTTVPRGFTSTTTTPQATAPSGTSTTTPTASPDNSPSDPTAATPQQQIDQLAAAPLVAPVPEPSTAVALSVALAGLGWLKHRSRKR